jgi:hypothetical protein
MIVRNSPNFCDITGDFVGGLELAKDGKHLLVCREYFLARFSMIKFTV